MNFDHIIQQHDYDSAFPGLCSYEDDIETATEDQLRYWLTRIGVTESEIEYRSEFLNESIRSIADDMVRQGHSFTFD